MKSISKKIKRRKPNVRLLVGIILCSVLIGLYAFANTPRQLDSIEDYVQWLKDEDNQIKQSVVSNEIEFGIQFKTIDYMLFHENKLSPESDEINEYKKDLEGGIYFTFRIFNREGSDPLKYKVTQQEDYNSRLHYYSFQAQEDFKVISGSDTLDCLFYHYERNFGISPELTFSLVFDTISNFNQKEFQFYYQDRIFGNGNVIFSYHQDNINKIPQLNISNQ